MAIEHIRVSQKAKDQLIQLKRKTGIKNWNILCRWGFCQSLADPTVPPTAKIPTDSSVEMSWKVFAGAYQDVYVALLKQRCQRDGLGTSEEVLSNQFRLHLHRGISYLAADKNIRNISSLIKKALNDSHQ
jgi:DNA sulfur modification protein DndE